MEVKEACCLTTELDKRGLVARLMLLDGSPYFSIGRPGDGEVFGCDTLQEIKTFIEGWPSADVINAVPADLTSLFLSPEVGEKASVYDYVETGMRNWAIDL